MKTIFVIEPDLLLGKAYLSGLQTKDRMVMHFRTASLAVRAMEKIVPDLVVLEIALPGHNGFEFLYEMLSYSDTKNTKVVINSLVQTTDLPWGFINRGDMNIVEHLYKPLSSVNALARTVHEHA